jgi:dipeptide transport system ATP-binding protein
VTALLDIRNLSVSFPTGGRTLQAVDDLTVSVAEGEVLGVVGESGSGKSVAMLAVMGLLGWPARIAAKRLAFAGQDLLSLGRRARRSLNGRDMAMIFQDPGISLNPCFTIGFQLAETLRRHENLGRSEARRRAAELLERVGIPEPERRLRAFPHQLSGGMNQRVMIAIAIACNPRLLIADEPTTALDVTIQAQILDLLLSLQRERGMALILISHSMGVIAETARRVAVMYAGQIVEEQAAEALFLSPQHPYTAGLLAALPERGSGDRLATLPGTVPGAFDRPAGCLFSPRCAYATRHSQKVRPELRRWQEGAVRCHYPLGDASRDARIRQDGPAPAEAAA